MTEKRRTELQNLAKGHWQAQILNDLLAGKEVTNPISFLGGKAKSYSGSYQTSFSNLLGRIKSAGLTVTKKLGPRAASIWPPTRSFFNCQNLIF